MFSSALVLNKSYASRLARDCFSNPPEFGKSPSDNKKSVSPLRVVHKLHGLSNKKKFEEKRVKYGRENNSSEEDIYGLLNKFEKMDIEEMKVNDMTSLKDEKKRKYEISYLTLDLGFRKSSRVGDEASSVSIGYKNDNKVFNMIEGEDSEMVIDADLPRRPVFDNW